MHEIIENTNAYSAVKSNLYRKIKVTVEIGIDCVPGWGDNVNDHILLMFQHNPYILNAIIENTNTTKLSEN